ncbi:unnamed protein product [marine sediment metagenome]|uniref:Uncharacterized protein n=1 Tax=marine sediment metagenome TaxID=412755 RepID=X0TUN9_9ZZZZ
MSSPFPYDPEQLLSPSRLKEYREIFTTPNEKSVLEMTKVELSAHIKHLESFVKNAIPAEPLPFDEHDYNVKDEEDDVKPKTLPKREGPKQYFHASQDLMLIRAHMDMTGCSEAESLQKLGAAGRLGRKTRKSNFKRRT